MKKARERKKTILLVEDDDGISILVSQELKNRGCAVLFAKNGEEALERVKQAPDLIWLDLYLPGMNGLEFLDRLKAETEYAKIPVVIVTVSRSKAEVAQHTSGVNVVGYYLKGAEPLAKIVDETLQLLKK